MFKKSALLSLVLLSAFLLGSSNALAERIIETRYYRSDTHEVNGLSANQLKLTNTDSNDAVTFGGLTNFPGGLGSDYYDNVYIKHSDGTETVLATRAALTDRLGFSHGYQEAAWSCPETELSSGDALKIVSFVHMGNFPMERVFITEKLGATRLNAATWNFTRYSGIVPTGGGFTQWRFLTLIIYGDQDHATRIDGLSYEVCVDIGLRYYDGAKARAIACDTNYAPYNLRISKESRTYGIALVAVNHPDASKILVHDGKSVKAVRLL